MQDKKQKLRLKISALPLHRGAWPYIARVQDNLFRISSTLDMGGVQSKQNALSLTQPQIFCALSLSTSTDPSTLTPNCLEPSLYEAKRHSVYDRGIKPKMSNRTYPS